MVVRPGETNVLVPGVPATLFKRFSFYDIKYDKWKLKIMSSTLTVSE